MQQTRELRVIESQRNDIKAAKQGQELLKLKLRTYMNENEKLTQENERLRAKLAEYKR